MQILNESGFSNSSMQPCRGCSFEFFFLVSCCISIKSKFYSYLFFYRIILILVIHVYIAGNNAGDEEVEIGGNEPPVSSHSPMEIEKGRHHTISKYVIVQVAPAVNG